MCSLSGLRSITAVNALIASLILGPDKALRLVAASVAIVAAVGCTRAIASAPAGGVYSQEFINKLSRDDKTTWGSLLQLIQTFDKYDVLVVQSCCFRVCMLSLCAVCCLKGDKSRSKPMVKLYRVTDNMPVLNKPAIVRLRDHNPPELFLRLLALVYQHQCSQHHSPSAADTSTASQPRSAAAVARADSYLLHALRCMANGQKGAAAARLADCKCADTSMAQVCGSAHQTQGTPAPTSLIQVRSCFAIQTV